MNAPLVFLLAPICMALIAFAVYSARPRGVAVGSSLLCICLATLSFFLPVDQPISFFGFSIPVSHSLLVLGRNFVFDSDMRAVLSLLYLFVSAFFIGGMVIGLDRFFLPGSLAVLSFLTAALFVQPFLFASFFLFFSVCIFSLLLVNGSRLPIRATSRLLVFSLLSVPFLLLAGSLLSLSTNASSDDSTFRTCLSLLGIGFALLLTIPPMHFWQLDAVDDSNSYSFFFILSLYTSSILFFMLRFFNEYEWLRLSPLPFQGFQWVGIFLCIIGSLFSLLQDRLGRLLIYLSMINLGVCFLSLSTRSPAGLEVFFVLLSMRCFIFFLCGLSFHHLHTTFPDDHIETIRGLFYRLPVSGLALFLSLLTLSGFPGLLSFPGIWATLRLLSLSSEPSDIAVWVMLLSMGIGSLAVFYQARFIFPVSNRIGSSNIENRFYQFFLITLLIIFFMLSLFPQLYFPFITNATSALSNIWHN